MKRQSGTFRNRWWWNNQVPKNSTGTQRRYAICEKCAKFVCIKCNLGLDPDTCFVQYNSQQVQIDVLILNCTIYDLLAEVESSRTFLASRTQFEDLGFGLETCKSSKMLCPRVEDSIIFWRVENGPRSWPIYFVLKNFKELAKKYLKTFFFLENAWSLRKMYKILERRPFLWRSLPRYVLSPWPRTFLSLAPRKDLSSEGLSLALASDLFVSLALDLALALVLALASSLVSSTPPLFIATLP